jgi:hypothetical protein
MLCGDGGISGAMIRSFDHTHAPVYQLPTGCIQGLPSRPRSRSAPSTLACTRPSSTNSSPCTESGESHCPAHTMHLPQQLRPWLRPYQHSKYALFIAHRADLAAAATNCMSHTMTRPTQRLPSCAFFFLVLVKTFSLPQYLKHPR